MSVPDLAVRPARRRFRVRRRIAAAADGAHSGRRDGRVDRHVPRGAAVHPGGHLRLPDRQRSGRAGRRQPAASRHEPRQGRPAPANRAVSHSEALARLLPVIRRRAHQAGFPALVVLGGDKSVGMPRSVEHAWQLRQLLHARDHTITLGGWANPHARCRHGRSTILRRRAFTQSSTSHRLSAITTSAQRGTVSRRRTAARNDTAGCIRRVLLPEREPSHRWPRCRAFCPCRVEGLTREFAAGASAEEVCARTLRTLLDVGARHFYISNLPIRRAPAVVASILERAGIEPTANQSKDR